MTDPNAINLRLRALEIAERTVANQYFAGTQSSSGSHRDKDMGEILSRADRILRYALDETDPTTQGLLNKLKEVLCPKT